MGLVLSQSPQRPRENVFTAEKRRTQGMISPRRHREKVVHRRPTQTTVRPTRPASGGDIRPRPT
jgi:hypothetical protein